MSLFPATAPVGVPLSLGATALQSYREDPEWFNQKMNALGKTFQPDPYATNISP
jgi:hypothetical protein